MMRHRLSSFALFAVMCAVPGRATRGQRPAAVRTVVVASKPFGESFILA
jgi:glycine betaine/choline ABC-type transport system substrate-binding protein